jgi:hypothetical protein
VATSSSPGASASGWADTIAELPTMQPAPAGPNAVVVGGYHAAGDGAGGLFYWDSTSTADANGGTVITPSSGHDIGRWTRIYSGPLSIRWFGAKGDLSVDDGPAIRAAYAAAVAANVPLHIPGSQVRPAAASGPAANLGYLIKPPAGEPPEGQLPGVGLNLPDPGIRIVGEGSSFGFDHFPGQGSKLVAGAENMVVLQLGNRDQEVSDIAIEGNVPAAAPAKAIAGVLLKSAIYSVLRRVTVANCADSAFLFDNHATGFPSIVGNNDSVRLEFCSANHSNVGVRIKPGPDNNVIDFLAMDLSGNISAGMELRGNLIRVWGGTFEGNGAQSGRPLAGYAITVPDDSPSAGILVHSPYFEGNTLANVYFGTQTDFCQYLSAMVSDPGDPLPIVGGLPGSIGTYVTGDPRNNFAEVRHMNTWGRSIRLSPGAALPVSAISCTGPTPDEALWLYGKGKGGVALGYYGSPVQGLWTSDNNPSPATDTSHEVPGTTLSPGQSLSVTITVSNNNFGAHPKLGDLAIASFSQPLPQDVTISAAAVSDDHVRVTLVNNSSAPAPVPTGYIRVGVFVM